MSLLARHCFSGEFMYAYACVCVYVFVSLLCVSVEQSKWDVGWFDWWQHQNMESLFFF